MTRDLKPKTTEELIALIDENYADIMSGADFSFDTRVVEPEPAKQQILAALDDKPVLQHIMRCHMEHGASFTAAGNLLATVGIMRDIRMPDQINAAIVSTALKSGNFKGDMMNALDYLDFGPGR